MRVMRPWRVFVCCGLNSVPAVFARHLFVDPGINVMHQLQRGVCDRYGLIPAMPGMQCR